MCHSPVPSTAASWLFSRPCSGFGGRGGGVFCCLISDISNAPADVCWQNKKKQTIRSQHAAWMCEKIFNSVCLESTQSSAILYFVDPESVFHCHQLSLAFVCQLLVSGREAEYGSLISYRVLLYT